MKRDSLLLFLIFSIIFVSHSEKWVGQVATFNLLPGTKMKNGESFNSEAFYAACNGFKLGANVNVVNVTNGKSIQVTITDSINTESNYFLLLTPGAARTLGLERETSLAVVEGKFSDVNTMDTMLEVNGLIAEGSIDEEKIKRFPEIRWPDDDRDITKKIVEKNEKDEVINRDNTKPTNERILSPNKIMEKYLISEDFDEKFIPKIDNILTNPFNNKENKKMGDYPDDKNSPKNDYIKNPPNKNDKKLAEDGDDKNSPKNDYIKNPPNKNDKKLAEDGDDKNSPKNDYIKNPPNKNDKKLAEDGDDKNSPKNDYIKNPPNKNDKRLAEDGDDKNSPKNDYVKNPLKKEKFVDIDIEDKNIPNYDKKNFPYKKLNLVEEDKDSVETKKPVNWITSLPKDKIFVRFSTTFEKNEGDRRFNLFKEIFRNIISYRDGNKYILMIGPISEKEIDKTVKGLRSFGYKDAYIISN